MHGAPTLVVNWGLQVPWDHLFIGFASCFSIPDVEVHTRCVFVICLICGQNLTDLLRLYFPYTVGPSFVPAVPLSDDSQVYFWVPKELVLPGKSIKQAAKHAIFFWSGEGESLVKAIYLE